METRRNRRRSGKSSGAVTPSRNTRTAHPSLALFLEGTTEGHWDWKLKSGEVHLGGCWLSSLGYVDTNLPCDQSVWEIVVHPDDMARFKSQLQAHLDGSIEALDVEVRLREKTGSYKWFRTRGKVIQRDRRGKAMRVVGSILDIQTQKRTQEELAESRAQLEALREGTKDIIWSVDARDFRLLAFNKAFRDLMDSRGIHVRTGMSLESLTSREKLSVWRSLCGRVLEQGRVDGDVELLLDTTILHLTAHTLERGGQVYGISFFGRDITERKRIEEDLRKSEEKFSKAFRESPLALTITSMRDHRYLEVNEGFELASGYSRTEVLGRTAYDLNIWVDPGNGKTLVDNLKKKGHCRNVGLQYRTKAGAIRDALGSAALVEIDNEPCMLTVIIDVTDRKQAEQALQDSEERLRLAVASGRMYAFEWDCTRQTIKRSSESSTMLRLPDGKPGERELEDYIHPEDRELFRKRMESVTAENPKYKVIFRFVHSDGAVSWLEESGHAFFNVEGTVQRVVGMVTDITEARQSERVLRELSGRLITSQEEERRRVARELHDNIGQELALISVQAQRIDSGVSETEQVVHSDVHELYGRIKAIATKVSNLSHRLHSSELEFLGLTIAVERLCRDFGRQYRIGVDYQIKDVPKLIEPNIALCFYRIIQEALQNVAKHSRASRVDLELAQLDGKLTLNVRDNGAGFAIDKTAARPGLGLVSIRERINLIGGHIEISAKEGQGTEIRAAVVLPKPLAMGQEREGTKEAGVSFRASHA